MNDEGVDGERLRDCFGPEGTRKVDPKDCEIVISPDG